MAKSDDSLDIKEENYEQNCKYERSLYAVPLHHHDDCTIASTVESLPRNGPESEQSRRSADTD